MTLLNLKMKIPNLGNEITTENSLTQFFNCFNKLVN